MDLTFFGLGWIVGHHIACLTRRDDPRKVSDTVMVGIGLAAILFSKLAA